VAEEAWGKTDQKGFWSCVNQSAEICKFAAAYNTIISELKRGGKSEQRYVPNI
jgi:hypothetical protein